MEAGADPRSADGDARTPLHEACLEGNLEIAEHLIEKSKEMFGDEYAKAVSFKVIARKI